MTSNASTDRKYAAALPAVLHVDGRDLACQARDLGRDGVLLVGDLPEPERPELGLTLRSAGGDVTVYAQGRLTFFKREAEGAQAHLGVQFVELAEAQREALELLLARVVEGMAPAALDDLPRGASVAQVRERLSRIPVAHRVALARRAQSRERQFLRHDPDPHVLESLVRNPNIVLPEIIQIARMPLLEKAGMNSHWAGLYEVTPDAHPFYGKTPVEGFFIVGGFSGHGFMHGPISGVLMSEFVLDGEARTVDVSMLDLARFEEGRLIHEYNVV